LAEQRYRLFRLIVKLLINWAGGIGLGYVTIALPAQWTAGKWTILDVTYRAIIEGTLGLKISLGVNAALFLLWLWQRRTFNRAIAREHERVPELELTKDPKRSSSTLKD